MPQTFRPHRAAFLYAIAHWCETRIGVARGFGACRCARCVGAEPIVEELVPADLALGQPIEHGLQEFEVGFEFGLRQAEAAQHLRS